MEDQVVFTIHTGNNPITGDNSPLQYFELHQLQNVYVKITNMKQSITTSPFPLNNRELMLLT